MLDYIFLFIFFLSGFLIAHTYLFFPFLMKLLSKSPQEFTCPVPRLKVAILMAAYNEEQVIRKKMDSTLNTNYPMELLEIWVGSDCSTDKTDEILTEYSNQYSNVHFTRFHQRTGKPQIINHLQEKVQADILILTDADTIFNKDTIPELVRPFANPEIGGVQASFIFIITHSENKDVAHQEMTYNKIEIGIKKGESRLGSIIGAEGACYAIRKSLYVPTPNNFIVDDFFIFMNVLAKGFMTVVNEKALAIREISGDSKVEFKRKIRIGSGNFQNFFYFKKFWLPFSITSWVYWSHKVLRWFTPFFLALFLLANIYLIKLNFFFVLTMSLQILIYASILLDYILGKLHLNFKILRFIKHFLFMNLALLLGFIKFVNGISRSSWDTKN